MIEAKKLGKKYVHEWIFRNFDGKIEVPTAIVGGNGSGKSTFLKVLTGIQAPSEGNLVYSWKNKNIDSADIFKYMDWVAPYLELVEEFTMKELLFFHQKFKLMKLSPEQIAQATALQKAYERPIKFFSSGMKQKLKLALAFFSQSPFLFLDEPTSNLDAQNIAWYQEHLAQQKDKLILIASNQAEEYEICEQKIEIADLKL